MERENHIHLRWIDVVKGICIIFVILHHSDINYIYSEKLGFPFWVEMAVPVFILNSRGQTP